MSDTSANTQDSSKAAPERNYKKTLNLPKTSFPMRANLTQNEPASQKRWDKKNLHDAINEQREAADAPRFVFHDGPPYANGSIHVGHLHNKVLKDFVVRSRLLTGYSCRYVPGWDCHGLPIEHMVMTGMVESGDINKLNELDDDARRLAIRKACKKYASKQLKNQSKQMQRLLTLADYDNPYLTMVPTYEKAVIEVFAELVKQGVVYRDLKAVHWSIANETALAEAELEYRDKDDVSVYVDFEAVDGAAVARTFDVELDQTPSFMIWTTTPWTLPANLAVAVHERMQYSLVKVDGNVTVIASELVEKVTSLGGAESVEVLAETDGRGLLGLEYRHPFCDRVSPIVGAEYVTAEDGTGLVHTAPGHGEDDYQTGLREGLDIYCPVLRDGTYDDSVPDWLKGMLVWDANDVVVKHLRASGHLFHDLTFTHSYPHDWRSKTPIIFRATEQWFVGVDRPIARDGNTLRKLATDATASKIKFVPEWGRKRMQGMLETRPDWCLSRQRAWGLPIPSFETPDGDVLLTPASVQAIADVFGERGSDAWFIESPEQLLANYDAASDPDAPDDLDISSLRKMHDIFDVWFESGSSWNAVMRQRDLGFPIDLYLEGSDQHRGWFQLSLLPGLGVTGVSPFKSVLTHGFIVDKDGYKMSKSVGNTLDVDEMVAEFGADVCRWWASSLAYENDSKADKTFLELAGDSYRKVRNTIRFLLSNLADFVPCTAEQPDGMCVDLKAINGSSIDAYALHETMKLQERVLDAYANYEFRRANQLIYDYCNDTLSAFYCTTVKDRLYCDRPDSVRRRTTQTVMWDIIEVLCRLLAPIIPHTADEMYRALWKDDTRCVHEKQVAVLALPALDEHWSKAMAARDLALKALEEAKSAGIDNPLDASVTIPDPGNHLQAFEADFADMLGVSRVTFDEGVTEVSIQSLLDQPRCERSWKRDGTVCARSDGGMLSDRDAEAVGVK